MKKMQFKTDINAPVANVFSIMLDKETFRQWTAVFNPESDFETPSSVEGNWHKGSKILFIGASKTGKREGMVGWIRENIPNKFVSIEYTGIVDGDDEITTGPVAEEWQGFENYSFAEENGTTTVTVDIDVNDEMVDYFAVTYPKALEKLKEICEA